MLSDIEFCKLHNELVQQGKTNKEIAAAMGWTDDRHMRRRRAKLEAKGHEIHRPGQISQLLESSDGQRTYAKSTLIDGDGNIRLQWVKEKEDQSKLADYWLESAEAILNNIAPHTPIAPPSAPLQEDLANMYTFTDYHIGMLAWHEEGGHDWDVNIAKQTLKAAWHDMFTRAPKADTCIINQLGDWAHYDSLESVTPTSRHVLDADTRPKKLIDALVECMDYLIKRALETHNQVVVVIAQGNHDLYGSLWMRKLFDKLYEHEPRLTIVDSALPFYAYQWGRNLLGFHHGHKVKFDQLPALFANEFRKLYGVTDRTYIHMGHYHHKQIKEIGKTVVEMHRTLAARDAHASYGGYVSERSTDMITYHKQYGEIGRLTYTPMMG